MKEGSANVFANSLDVCREGDPTTGQHKGSCSSPTILQPGGGSPDVFANNIPVDRVGDPIVPHCGVHLGVVDTGSPNVFVNGGGDRYVPVIGPGGAQPAAPIYPPTNDGLSELKPGVTNGDAGNLDDNIPDDDGLILYPSGSITNPADVAESQQNGYDPYAPPPDTIEEDQTPPATEPPIPVDCTDVQNYWDNTILPNDSSFHPNHYTYPLAGSYTLYDVTTGPAVSTYIMRPNVGLTEVEIVCNLVAVAQNILVPLQSHLGTLTITSGFRHGSGSSQHNRGQAVDIQVAGFTTQQYWDTAIWIRDNIAYDQFILEYGGRNPWFHISFNRTGNRTEVLTQVRPGQYESGLIRVR